MTGAGRILTATAVAALLVGAPSPTHAGKPLEGSAPSVLAGLLPLWLGGYSATHPGFDVDIPPPYGPPQGALSPRLEEFLAGRRDFAFVSRKLAARDFEEFNRRHGYLPVIIPVAGGSWNSFGFVDPVVVIVNSDNPVRALSFGQLDAIYSKSRRRGHTPIRWWNQIDRLRPGKRPIHIVGGASWSSEDSARASVFRERVMLGGLWRDDQGAIAGGTEQEVPALVAADPLAIGFTGFGHLIPGTRALSLVPPGGMEPIAPTYSAVASARYPLVRTVDLVVARKPGTCLSSDLRSFVRYLIGRGGQDIIRADGHFLPLTRAQARQSWLRARSCR